MTCIYGIHSHSDPVKFRGSGEKGRLINLSGLSAAVHVTPYVSEPLYTHYVPR
jgi:hypothetical protein